ncbi:hypothetical protein GCM10027059_45540 [Myceligenerans halotolerans]
MGRRAELAARRRSRGMTQESLAAQLQIERTTVARWEAGHTAPMPWVRPLLAQLLDITPDHLDLLLSTHKMGSQTTSADPTASESLIAQMASGSRQAGPTDLAATSTMTDSDVGRALLFAAGTLRGLAGAVSSDVLGHKNLAEPELQFPDDLDRARANAASLWQQQARQQDRPTMLPFVKEATADAGWRWLLDPADDDTSHRGERRVTPEDIDALRSRQEQFLQFDRRHGGGTLRGPLAGWLHRDVEPMLHGAYSDRVGRQLFAATAELTGQLAFMSYDAGDHGLAQRHFIQALRLAKAGDHAAFGAHVLANMSTQAVYLRQPGEAVRLARAAVDGGRGSGVVMARLHTAAAAAHAAAGDARRCADALGRAEVAIDRSTETGDEPGWAQYFTRAHLAGTAIRSLRDLGRTKEALEYADQALDLREGNIRTRALHTALIGSVHATGSSADPGRASQLGHDALDLAGRLRSGRVADRIAGLERRLSTWSGTPAVDEFLHRARSYVLPAGRR